MRGERYKKRVFFPILMMRIRHEFEIFILLLLHVSFCFVFISTFLFLRARGLALAQSSECFSSPLNIKFFFFFATFLIAYLKYSLYKQI